jgi:hypothetical protein
LSQPHAGATVHNQRRFVRLRPISRAGKIIVDPKKPIIECDVVDLSAAGACLQVRGQEVIPKRFVLLHAGTKKKCSLVWKTGTRLGVIF